MKKWKVVNEGVNAITERLATPSGWMYRTLIFSNPIYKQLYYAGQLAAAPPSVSLCLVPYPVENLDSNP